MTTSQLDVHPDAALPADAAHEARRRKRWAVALSLFFILAVAAVWIFLHAGTWLVVQDPLVPADVIVVLSGQMPYRALEAARLYQQQAAPQIWVSRPIGPAQELAEMQISFVGEDFYSQRVLLAKGVPVLATRVLPDPSANTAQEIEQIGRMAREENLGTVIIVTSAPHTRRVRTIWRRLIGDAPRLIVRHPLDDSFNASRWWRNTGDALDIVREWLGLANAWAGFPSQPGRN